MSTAGTEKAVREGSPAKRTAILDAARDLFLRQGVDRVSMDAVAARAEVSKRTVYDYFGDKRRLFLAILADASDSVTIAVRRAIDEHLADDAGITTVPQLEKALAAFAIDVGSTMHSAHYAAVFGLVAQERLRTPTTEDDLVTAPTEEMTAERIGHFADSGLLDTDDPSLAAGHFFALTVLLAYERQPVPDHADPETFRRAMVDGVHAFIRAYATR
ncbi:TetR/AcrR family transcriptional regulator [Streptomyces corynorhini]|uniref:TetR/AcrR family transcriptional regulator n=1 Tax=Streptomyces corynorhini TaxID=2282652 RepID=A0A370BB23_9ACTN|nr:TetR/AcrR family transcriptional regulator [Streptomyces corynorhini]RDG38988.1 TetR/AcrR family transcriptional regulator [Streptomyces corynorhini]